MTMPQAIQEEIRNKVYDFFVYSQIFDEAERKRDKQADQVTEQTNPPNLPRGKRDRLRPSMKP